MEKEKEISLGDVNTFPKIATTDVPSIYDIYGCKINRILWYVSIDR